MATEFSHRVERSVVILSISGRLDASSAPLLESQLNSLMTESKNCSNNCILDMSKVDYLSSAGMRVILATSKQLSSVGGKLVLASVSDDLLEVLRLAGFDRIISICPNEQDAISQFQSLK